MSKHEVRRLGGSFDESGDSKQPQRLDDQQYQTEELASGESDKCAQIDRDIQEAADNAGR